MNLQTIYTQSPTDLPSIYSFSIIGTHPEIYVWISTHCYEDPWQSTLGLEVAGKSPVYGYRITIHSRLFSTLKSLSLTAKRIYQGRKHFFSCPTRNWKATMSTGVASCQSFAEVICWLFALGTQVCWKKWDLFLLLLHETGDLIETRSSFSRVRSWK